MSSLTHDLLLLLALLHLLLPTFCLDKSSLSSPQGMLTQEKIRLGSTPPSCHNKCNECNPCTAVQIPTLPGRTDPGLGRPVQMAHPLADQPSYTMYSNYKPLGWKCRCGNHLYNP
ncbi:EPIDERMAL PATTERNING FACTOR-like protein 1 [Elaeis guineensis]|uniref:Epidermal patterning factor-like protein n=1 Tax=Elaeis guineensis var. tenera TaxID=51953 RepID=A0A6I9S460_ELAGV|nr:EPIDERMAL PATTERNING FACTOR-like protein 1 [Elaeis guineensis]